MKRKRYPFAHTAWIHEAITEHAFTTVIGEEPALTKEDLYQELSPGIHGGAVEMEALVNIHVWVRVGSRTYAFSFSDEPDNLEPSFNLYRESVEEARQAGRKKSISAYACLMKADFTCSTVSEEHFTTEDGGTSVSENKPHTSEYLHQVMTSDLGSIIRNHTDAHTVEEAWDTAVARRKAGKPEEDEALTEALLLFIKNDHTPADVIEDFWRNDELRALVEDDWKNFYEQIIQHPNTPWHVKDEIYIWSLRPNMDTEWADGADDESS